MNSAKRILIVDDSPVLRASVSRSLTNLGFEVMEAQDGLDGLKVLKENRLSIDLVLLDWFMPNCNGQEFLEIYQRDESIVNIPVIMVTTASDPQRMVNALKLGARHYVVKPFTEEVLIRRIRQVLELDEEVL